MVEIVKSSKKLKEGDLVAIFSVNGRKGNEFAMFGELYECLTYKESKLHIYRFLNKEISPIKIVDSAINNARFVLKLSNKDDLKKIRDGYDFLFLKVNKFKPSYENIEDIMNNL